MKMVSRLITVIAVAAVLVTGSGCRGGRIPTGLFKTAPKTTFDPGKFRGINRQPFDPSKFRGLSGIPGANGQAVEKAVRGIQPAARGTRVPFVLVSPRPAGEAAKKALAPAAEHVDDVIFHADPAKFGPRLPQVLANNSHLESRVHLVMLRDHIAVAKAAANLRQSLHSASHEIESHIQNLPESVQKPIRAWLGVCDSCEALAVRWDQTAPSATQLCRSLKEVNSASPKLADRFRIALIDKAKASGKGEIEGALRDLKLGAPEPEVAAGVAANRAALLPLPEAPAASQAGQKSSALKGLGDLGEEATKDARAVYTNAVRQTTRFHDIQNTIGSQHLHQVSRLGSKVVEQHQREREREQRRDLFVAVERGLKDRHGRARTLRPSERLIIADMGEQNPDVIIKKLAALD